MPDRRDADAAAVPAEGQEEPQGTVHDVRAGKGDRVPELLGVGR